VYEELHQAPLAESAEAPTPVIEPMAAAPIAAAPMMGMAPIAATPAAIATPAAEAGRPELDIAMEPVRAGVTGEEAVVEFALTVDNHGNAPARDVRISTWMFPAGAPGSEMERMLIKSRAPANLPQLDAGEAERIQSAVSLPTSGIGADSVLPVVVAEARYRLADGSEGRTSATFAVGVPLDGELAHFDVENPSGLHEGVEAWPLGQTEKA